MSVRLPERRTYTLGDGDRPGAPLIIILQGPYQVGADASELQGKTEEHTVFGSESVS